MKSVFKFSYFLSINNLICLICWKGFYVLRDKSDIIIYRISIFKYNYMIIQLLIIYWSSFKSYNYIIDNLLKISISMRWDWVTKQFGCSSVTNCIQLSGAEGLLQSFIELTENFWILLVHESTIATWARIWYTTAAIYIFGAVWYAFFASAEQQPWAEG